MAANKMPKTGIYSDLSEAQARLLHEVLSEKAPELESELSKGDYKASVSQSTRKILVRILTKEFMNNLRPDWEPTEHGKEVDALIRQLLIHLPEA